MREIKFRLRIGDKIVGYEKWTLTGWFYSTDGLCDWNDKYIYHTNKDQFTGLHDTKGVEIYEGDISQDCAHKDWITKIEWLKDEARFGGIQGNLGEVIGNIYEHPELLKGGSSE